MKSVIVTQEVYKCEHCDYNSNNDQAVLQHEKTHKQLTCGHLNLRYFLDYDVDDNVVDCVVKASCQDCLLEAAIGLQNYNQEQAKKIFEAVDGPEVLGRLVQRLKEAEELKRQAQAKWEETQLLFEKTYGRKMNEVEIGVFRPLF